MNKKSSTYRLTAYFSFFILFVFNIPINVLAAESRNHIEIVLSDSLVNKLSGQYNCEGCDLIPLVKEFQEEVKDHINLGKPSENPVIETYFSDLDGDASIEILLNIGWNNYGTYKFCVVKRVLERWRLIYVEDVFEYIHSENRFSQGLGANGTTFFIKQDYNNQTSKFHFYKIIDGEVHRVLELLTNSRACGNNLHVCQEISSNFSVINSDTIMISYFYKYHLNNIDGPYDNLIIRQPVINLVHDNETTVYKWNNKALKFEFIETNGVLNAERINLFNYVGRNKLFVSAFRSELDKIALIETRRNNAVHNAIRKISNSKDDKYPVNIRKWKRITGSNVVIYRYNNSSGLYFEQKMK